MGEIGISIDIFFSIPSKDSGNAVLPMEEDYMTGNGDDKHSFDFVLHWISVLDMSTATQ